MKNGYSIHFVNFDSTNNVVLKSWFDSHVFDTSIEAFEAAQTAVRASQALIKRGVLYYRIMIVEAQVE